MSAAAAIRVARHELAALRRAPVLVGLAALFLVVQGLAFAGQVAVLADPARPAPMGAVLHGYFAGNLLSWAVWLAVLAALAVRAVGDDRRSGRWELLITAPVSDGAAVVGVWLAGAAAQLILWLPTLLYVLVVVLAAPGDARFAWGPIVAAYAGVLLVGAALLALAMAVAARVASPLVGFAAAVAALLVAIVIGDVAGVWSDAATSHPGVVAALGALDVRAVVASVARGDVPLAGGVLVAALTAGGLVATTTALGRGRRRQGWQRRAALSTVLVGLIGAAALALAVRADAHLDVSGDRASSVAPRTRAVLAGLPADRAAELVIVRPQLAAFAPIYDEVERTVGLLVRLQPRLAVRRLDAAAAPAQVRRLASEAGLAEGDLASSGAVVVVLGGQRRIIDLLDLVEVGRDALAAPTVTRFTVEAALTARLDELTGAPALRVCVLAGEGEATLGAARDEHLDPRGWSDVGDRLRAAGATLTLVPDTEAASLQACDVVVVAGGTGRAPGAGLGLGAALARGTGVVLALTPDAPSAAWLGVAATAGVEVADRAVTDGSQQVDDAGRFRVVDGYPPHPVNAGFARRRLTTWLAPLELALRGATATALLATSRGGRAQQGDAARVRVFAAAAGAPGVGRLVVLGTDDLQPAASAGVDAMWVAAATRWAAGRDVVSSDGSGRAPEVVRLQLTASERRLVSAACVAGVPLLVLMLGAAPRLRRRRGGGA